MDRSNFCGCKGVRTCIKCEQEFGYENKNIVEFTKETYVYCPHCNKAWQGSDLYAYQSHPNHSGKSFDIGGVYIKEDFLSEAETEDVMKQLDDLPWDKSQSGRRKQNFGPKCNFKKQKIKLGDFQGFPACTKFIQDRFHQEDVLSHFQTIEQCTLEYNSENGSSIDNHIDDCWIWGERIVTVNLIGDSVLTLTYYNGDSNKYNLNSPCFSYQKKYPDQKSTIVNDLSLNEKSTDSIVNETLSSVVIRIPMPARSLLVLWGEARYEWQHCVLRSDVIGRRVCIAYREFTAPYMNNEATASVFEKAKCFF
ncbi:alpha-ketoglutarate-dependent dioxygenase alkB homolog 4 isoform X1 [Diaphorina citri]|uniref:Alpha-ketoglutarate-dependent dioxygenase alkB homolog 4 isoform X1 n=1 Tax=Diaphorina citri TaxID=121845 RepID=A0A1S3D6Z8_DIACI|nr:alpha-ketoglutarate-dependent dioxygenase alkB homolog 4 isoform X2 [Diaphorina citri]XP_017300625.1 alpha-ketoglutarate-dependent dioxygenase alkB homolog 4 isoform X1 [Diaphorina citri]